MGKETYYFSHDYNARSDPKIKKLLAKWGYPGYGVFWGLIEDLYQNANALPLDYDCIAYDMRSSEDMVKSIINDFGLFVIEDNSFGSFSVQRRLEERAEKSEKARQSAFKRWGDDANAMRTHSDCNAIKERKGNENKGNENKELNISFDVFWEAYDKKVGDKIKVSRKWGALTNVERELIIAHLSRYKLAQPDKKYRKNPETYLNNKSWNDEIIGGKDEKQGITIDDIRRAVEAV